MHLVTAAATRRLMIAGQLARDRHCLKICLNAAALVYPEPPGPHVVLGSPFRSVVWRNRVVGAVTGGRQMSGAIWYLSISKRTSSVARVVDNSQLELKREL